MLFRLIARRDDRQVRRSKSRRSPRLEALDGRLLLSSLGASAEVGLQSKMAPEFQVASTSKMSVESKMAPAIKHGW